MLQTFDQDSLTGNEHVLYDRVGIGVMPRKIEHSRWFDDTGLELPLDDAELEQLIARVDSLVAALLEAPAAAQ